MYNFYFYIIFFHVLLLILIFFFSLGTKKNEYILQKNDDGSICKIPWEPPNDKKETAAENAVKFSRFSRPKNENVHAGWI